MVTYRLKKLQRASNVPTTRQHILELVHVIYKKKAFLLYFFRDLVFWLVLPYSSKTIACKWLLKRSILSSLHHKLTWTHQWNSFTRFRLSQHLRIEQNWSNSIFNFQEVGEQRLYVWQVAIVAIVVMWALSKLTKRIMYKRSVATKHAVKIESSIFAVLASNHSDILQWPCHSQLLHMTSSVKSVTTFN